jgi:hypothetical protein
MINSMQSALEAKREEDLKAATGFYPHPNIPLYIYYDVDCPTDLSQCDRQIWELGIDLNSMLRVDRKSEKLETKIHITRTKIFLLNDWRRNHCHQIQIEDLKDQLLLLSKRVTTLEGKNG